MTNLKKHKALQEAQHLLNQATRMIESIANSEIDRTAFAADSIAAVNRKPHVVYHRAMELKNLCHEFDKLRVSIR